MSYWRSKGVVKDLRRDGIDIYLGLSNEIPVGLQASKIKSIVCMHDLFYKDFPSQFNWIDRFIINKKTKFALKNADLILAMSQYTKSSIQKHFPIEEQEAKVLYQAVNPQIEQCARIETPQEAKEHFLFVGSLNERKNLNYIIDAYKNLEPEYRRKIIVVGRGKNYKRKAIRKIEELGLNDYFVFKEGITQLELIELYNKAMALISPSQFEGFRLPVLEAMILGVPIIAAHNSSLTELTGKHGIIIDLSETSSLNIAIKDIVDRRHEGNKVKLLSHLEQFNSQLLSQKLMALIQELAQ